MFKNYMWSKVLMDEPDDGGSGFDVTKIDWSTFDFSVIPEDVIKKTPAFVKVRDEAATRRKENTQLKKQVEASVKDVEVDEEKPEDKPETKPNTDEVPQWAKDLQTRMDNEQVEKVTNWREEAAKLYNIKSVDVVATLKGATRSEILAAGKKLAEELGLPAPTPEQSGINPNIVVGNPVQTRDKGFLARVKSEMYGGRGEKANPFSPEVQRSMGGGAVIMDD